MTSGMSNNRPILQLSIAALIAVVGCTTTKMVAYTPTQVPVAEDPDALYGASVRVFLKRGWGFQSRDASARAIETKWISWSKHRAQWYEASFRVITYEGRISVFTNCRLNDNGLEITECPKNTRPEGISEFEQKLIAEIVEEARNDPSDSTGISKTPSMRNTDTNACVRICGDDRSRCSTDCGNVQSCKRDCGDGYKACLSACGSGRND
jgi:hypothetical protein